MAKSRKLSPLVGFCSGAEKSESGGSYQAWGNPSLFLKYFQVCVNLNYYTNPLFLCCLTNQTAEDFFEDII